MNNFVILGVFCFVLLIFKRVDTLKRRLQKDFPELIFHRPSRQNESELVSCAEVTAGSVVERFEPHESSTSSSSSQPSDVEGETQSLPSTANVYVDQEAAIEGKIPNIFLFFIFLRNQLKKL